MPDRIIKKAYQARLATQESVVNRLWLTILELETLEQLRDYLRAVKKEQDAGLAIFSAQLDDVTSVMEARGLQNIEDDGEFYHTAYADELIALSISNSQLNQARECILSWPGYKHFTSSLALLTDLDMDKVKAAFQTEEMNRRPRPDPSASSALSASTSTCRCNPSSPCAFCEKAGHCQCKCYALQRAKDNYKSSKRSGRRPNQANATAATPTSPLTTSTTDTANMAAQDVVERAGNASLRSIDPSDPLSPLQLDADAFVPNRTFSPLSSSLRRLQRTRRSERSRH